MWLTCAQRRDCLWREETVSFVLVTGIRRETGDICFIFALLHDIFPKWRTTDFPVGHHFNQQNGYVKSGMVLLLASYKTMRYVIVNGRSHTTQYSQDTTSVKKYMALALG